MALPPENRMRFFVFVVESPSPVDIYHRRSEGEIIQQAVNLNQIPCIVKTAINFQAFDASLKIGLKEAMEAYPGMFPILHVSAHGHQEGIELSSGELIDWSGLKELFRPVNEALNNNLLVCLSSCEGYSGVRMAMTLDNETYPYFAIVANGEKPLWSDTAVAYSTFYHLLAKGEFITTAVDAMCIASGNNNFFVRTAEDARKGYLEYINNINTEEIQQRLEENIAEEPPENLKNLMKLGESKMS